jgi:hypothetical protein
MLTTCGLCWNPNLGTWDVGVDDFVALTATVNRHEALNSLRLANWNLSQKQTPLSDAV